MYKVTHRCQRRCRQMGKAPEPGAPEARMLGVTSEGSGLLTPASTPQSSLRSSPCAPWGPISAWSSWVSSWNSPGRAPSPQLRAGARSASHSCLAKVGAVAAQTRRPRTAGPGWGPRRAHVPRRCRARVPGPPQHAAPAARMVSSPAAHQVPRLQQAGTPLPSELFLRINSHKEDPAEFDNDGFADSSHSNIS